MFAVKVKDKNFVDREIKISYNPLTCEFAVWSQAYEKDTEWISRISDVFLAKEDIVIVAEKWVRLNCIYGGFDEDT